MKKPATLVFEDQPTEIYSKMFYNIFQNTIIYTLGLGQISSYFQYPAILYILYLTTKPPLN